MLKSFKKIGFYLFFLRRSQTFNKKLDKETKQKTQ